MDMEFNGQTAKSALEEYFTGAEVTESGEWAPKGMEAFDVDGEGTFIVGDYDTCYEAAVEEAANAFEECYSDEDKVKWLQEWNWPGVDTESLLEDINVDMVDSYDDEEDSFEYSDLDSYIDDMGGAESAFSWSFLRGYVNTRELGEFVVDTDGIANGLARYDGEEIDLDDGFLAFRVD